MTKCSIKHCDNDAIWDGICAECLAAIDEGSECYGSKMKVLVACEESQAVTKAFRALGHEAYSCDIQPCSGGHPEWHIMGDVLEQLSKGWDLMIAHPPCTFLSVSGARWMYHADDKHLPTSERIPHPKHPHRRQYQREALDFVQALMDAPIPKIAVENPVSVISSQIRKPDQIIQPWQFGHEATKKTCLWLKNLPKLEHTKVVEKGARVFSKSGKSYPEWMNSARSLPDAERRKARSKTFSGMAEAMADQWGKMAWM